ncbi:transposase [Streptomyces sp. NPDC059083]|uniref:transposase n=1 Tax=Streptomyces sp. NPDC059083 TaxID=3346721 RepID=UPI0036B26916
MWIVTDAGYDAPRLAFLLADLPVAVLGRMWSDRVLRRHAATRRPGVSRPWPPRPRHVSDSESRTRERVSPRPTNMTC